MLLCSALNLIFEHGRISGSGKVNGAEAKWTSAVFSRSRSANLARTGYELLEFKPLHATRFAQGFLFAGLSALLTLLPRNKEITKLSRR